MYHKINLLRPRGTSHAKMANNDEGEIKGIATVFKITDFSVYKIILQYNFKRKKQKKLPQGAGSGPSPRISPSCCTSLKTGVRAAHLHAADHMFEDMWEMVRTCINR